MRPHQRSIGLALMLAFIQLVGEGCTTESGAAAGTGGAAGAGGVGDGGVGGGGGVGGTGGEDGQPCSRPDQCNDGEACTTELCVDGSCDYELLPDDTACFNGTNLSVCMSGVCQMIWRSCEDEGAVDGDFCRPTVPVPRLGRCVSGDCEILPCEIAFDCWDADLCTSDVCEPSSGECSHPNAPDGTPCGIAFPGTCVDGECTGPPP